MVAACYELYLDANGTGISMLLVKTLGVLLTSTLMAAQTARAEGLPSEGSFGSSSSDVSMREIAVAAEKRAERLMDVPMSITAVTGDQPKFSTRSY